MSKDWTGNYHSVCGCLGAHNECKEDREENDFYATQPIAAEWLIKLENLDNNIWECACGQGHLGKVFEEHGYNVLATDLIDRGYGQGGVDFLKSDGLFIGDIVTNPPYKYAQEFIEHALSLIPDGYKVCMFLKVQFLEGKARRKLYTNCPPERSTFHQAVFNAGETEILREVWLLMPGMFGKRATRAIRFSNGLIE